MSSVHSTQSLFDAFCDSQLPLDEAFSLTLTEVAELGGAISIRGNEFPNKHPRDWDYSVWIKFRKTVLDRDNHQCQHCGSYRNLHVHHIKPWGSFPQDRFDTGNCITLCKDCHLSVHGKLRRDSDEYM